MEFIIIVIFLIGYLMITLEHPLKINKAAPALLLGVLCWAVFALFHGDYHHVEHELNHHLPEIVGILFFLMGAMTIVEIIDIHDGFRIITSKITTRNKAKLLGIVCVLTFFMSAALDNLTTAIVMASLLRKLLDSKQDRLVFASMVVISANAGGAWSPIGDVTTTMLWIEDCVTTGQVIIQLIIPSIVCMVVPLFIVARSMKGEFPPIEFNTEFRTTPGERMLVLIAGVSSLIFVPIFKIVTHLPPFMGMFLSLGFMWALTEMLHRSKTHDESAKFSPIHALSKIDTASILFFFGILAGVSVLSSIGTLQTVAQFLDNTIGNKDVIVLIIGALSSIVDNVPLVKGAIEMYDLTPGDPYLMTDGKLWEFLAYCAGTGGSMLIIGSAAGVAIMGIEKIEFFWYFKKFSWLALVGYLAGAAVYLLMYPIMH